MEFRTGTVRRLRETDSTGAILADYLHTGSGAVVLTDYQQPDLKLDLFGGTSGTYAGLDRFRRTIDHRWYDYTTGTVDVARYKYGYDNNSSGTWKKDTVAASNTVDLDEFYTYDGLNRLKAADRGNLNTGKTAISTLSFGQDWDQDQLGNWSGFTEDSNGNATNDLDQSRTHNDANEITDVTETTGPAWVTPAHDAAGNMTTVPQPAAPTSSYTLTWDSWNRLVKVADGANTVAEYVWDGSNRRIIKKTYAAGVLNETRHIYLSQSNQVLEERVDSSTSADRQFTWGTRYIDDLVLRTRDTDASGTLDETLYALQDANWNITALADTSGTIVERFQYTPCGHSDVLDLDYTADGDGISDYDWEYRFRTRVYDLETDLHYFRARYYHDGIGRFVGRDPLEFVDGGNLYAAYFVPNHVDPTGTDRYITQFDLLGLGGTGNWFSNLHVGVAVDTWKCKDGKFVKTGVKTFDFSLEYRHIRGWVWVFIWKADGRITVRNGLQLESPVTIKSSPCQDIAMLSDLYNDAADPPFYNIWAHQCIFWSVGAIQYGLDEPAGEECDCLCKRLSGE